MSEGGRPHQSELHGAQLTLLVPRPHVKAVKSALETHKRFDRNYGISPAKNEGTGKEQRMHVPTTIPLTRDDDEASLYLKMQTLLAELQLSHLLPDISLTLWIPSKGTKPTTVENNPLRKALRDALEALPPNTLASLNLTVNLLVSTFPDSYSIYKPLLLLPSKSLGSPWSSIISHHADIFKPVWSQTAKALQCTHIALNSPIPPSNTPSSAHAQDSSNILRSPVHLTPIHGAFGPPPTPQTLRAPSQQDFAAALWVHTTQNGIHQTWAPLYTMFSRGNVKEKARLLRLPCVTALTGPAQRPAATAVDMYAGIGYFAFSYRRAGLARVLCWELNPWSVEGLRRGAVLNNWRTRVLTPADVPSPDAGAAEWEAWREGVVSGGEEFCIFAMGNETAGRILQCLRGALPPIRHVNLGLLPVSRLSWPSAVRAVDSRLGGWIHAHENVGVVEMEERTVEVRKEFQRLVDEGAVDGEAAGDGADGRRGKVQVEHVEKVKMYAPGVVHAVFDVHVPGTGAAEEDARNTKSTCI